MSHSGQMSHLSKISHIGLTIEYKSTCLTPFDFFDPFLSYLTNMTLWSQNKKAIIPKGMTADIITPLQGLVYFCAKNSLILSLCTIDSLKVYAPDLGLRTALITFVQFFASDAAFWSFVLIAVFAAFAMILI